MKKHAIAIIGLVFAAFLLGACGEEIKTGGTIVVTNGSDNDAMLVAVGELLPNLDSAAQIDKGENKSFSFDKDGLYAIGFLAVGSGSGVNMQTKSAYLSGGKTINVTVP